MTSRVKHDVLIDDLHQVTIARRDPSMQFPTRIQINANRMKVWRDSSIEDNGTITNLASVLLQKLEEVPVVLMDERGGILDAALIPIEVAA